MSVKPTLGELLLGIEGLALLRLAFGDDAAARRARVSEIRSLVTELEDTPELAAPLEAPEYDLSEGYALWSKTYDRLLRLFPIEHPTMRALLDPLPASTVLDAACGTGRYSQYLAERGHRVIGVDRSGAMLAKAREKLPQCAFHEGDLEALPLEAASVDAAGLRARARPPARGRPRDRGARAGGPPRRPGDHQRRPPVPRAARLAGAVPDRKRRRRLHPAAPASALGVL
jgi:hypothetical protein